jgi:predicted transcriptional regulator
MGIKQDVIKLIQDLPEDVTLEDIMTELYVRAKIEDGIKQLDQGKALSHDKVKERMNKWLI